MIRINCGRILNGLYLVGTSNTRHFRDRKCQREQVRLKNHDKLSKCPNEATCFLVISPFGGVYLCDDCFAHLKVKDLATSKPNLITISEAADA